VIPVAARIDLTSGENPSRLLASDWLIDVAEAVATNAKSENFIFNLKN
jgi:hypothetical protein